MSCKRSTLKKYKDRPSPPYPANNCHGMRKKGSDGNWWVSVPDKSGVFRWKKDDKKEIYTIKKSKTVTTKKAKCIKESKKITTVARKAKGAMGIKPNRSNHSYFVHNNGSRPFQVDIQNGLVNVYEMNLLENQKRKNDGQIPVYHVSPQHIWLGDNYMALPAYDARGSSVGNSILLQTKKSNYVFIGHEIFSFDTGTDEVIEYYSPVGNSDVPYPYAVGREYVYFMLDNKRVPIEYVDLERDVYDQFYREIDNNKKVPFRVKIIRKPKN